MMGNPEKVWERLRAQAVSTGMMAKIRETASGEGYRFMEVCGTHTVNIARFGLRAFLQDSLELISGPGCPVCVTEPGDIDLAIELCRRDQVILTTFGDVMKVPGSRGSLLEEKAGGQDIRVIYSPQAAVDMAASEGKRQVVFVAIGFETTIPVILVALERAVTDNIANFSLLVLQKTTPPAVRALLTDKESRIEGLLLPGHVSTIIGRQAWDFIREDFSLPAVVAGFDAMDILTGLYQLARMRQDKKPQVLNNYQRAVPEKGNPKALQLMTTYLEPYDGRWRGLGCIPGSGLKLKEPFRQYDAIERFNLSRREAPLPVGCLCGEILKGKKRPLDCPLFADRCTPLRAVGPCMVSSEGACGAYFQYERGGIPCKATP
jgi:hydrogenase expression/formation protein HypD